MHACSHVNVRRCILYGKQPCSGGGELTMVDSPEQLPVRLDGGDAGVHLDCRSGAVR